MSAHPPVWIVTQRQFAGHQGHSLLGHHLAASSTRLAGWTGSVPQRLLAKLLRQLPAQRGRSPAIVYHIFVANRLSRRSRASVGLVHLIWGDEVIEHSTHPERCIFTLHQPYELWTEKTWRKIAACAGVVCMAERESEEILRRCPGVPAVFIPHGIDVDFWKPVATPPRRQVCAVGRYMRNFDMFLRVGRVLLDRHPDVSLRWLVNPDFQVPPAVAGALPKERFELVRGLSAEDLHRFYTDSWLFFMPYDNVTASNAIVEAMSSGTPVFTTRVGGMVSYGGADAITMVGNNDDASMLNALTRCLNSIDVRREQAARGRRHAQTHFAWPRVVAAHEEFYAQLLAHPRDASGD